MVTQITLGNYGIQNGKSVITGGASQIDTKGLIEALVQAKRQPAVRLEAAATKIDDQTKALNSLKTILNKLQVATDALRSPTGVNSQSKNIFEYRTTSLSGMNGFVGSAADYVGVTALPGAAIQSYEINSVTQLAREAKQSTANINVADATTVSVVDGTVFNAGTTYLRALDGDPAGLR